MAVSRYIRGPIVAGVVFAMVIVTNMPFGLSNAGASPTFLHLGVFELGQLSLEYDGPPVWLEPWTDTYGWVLTGGSEPIPAADITFNVTLVSLADMTVLLLQIALYGTDGCTVTFHGPMSLDEFGGQYHGHFMKEDLGGVLYATACGTFVGLLLEMIFYDNILVNFHAG